MPSFRNFCTLLCWFALVALLHYELVAKSPRTPLGPLPGFRTAAYVDRIVPYRAHTGIVPVDRLLHECHEAALFYRLTLIGGPGLQ